MSSAVLTRGKDTSRNMFAIYVGSAILLGAAVCIVIAIRIWLMMCNPEDQIDSVWFFPGFIGTLLSLFFCGNCLVGMNKWEQRKKPATTYWFGLAGIGLIGFVSVFCSTMNPNMLHVTKTEAGICRSEGTFVARPFWQNQEVRSSNVFATANGWESIRVSIPNDEAEIPCSALDRQDELWLSIRTAITAAPDKAAGMKRCMEGWPELGFPARSLTCLPSEGYTSKR